MPFHYILANLLASNPHAAGVLFLDDTGETVDLACSDLSPYQMRVLGAYLGIQLKQQDRVLASCDLGTPTLLEIERDDLRVYAVPLPEEYYLVLVERLPAVGGLARRSLIQAAGELSREVFPS